MPIRERLDGVSIDTKANVYFDVPGQSSFEIEALEPVHYVCHFG